MTRGKLPSYLRFKGKRRPHSAIGTGRLLNSHLFRHIDQDAIGIDEMKHSPRTCGEKPLPRFSLGIFPRPPWRKRRIAVHQGGEIPLKCCDALYLEAQVVQRWP